MRNYSKNYWLLNLVQMLEKLTYWAVLLQLPVYISQKNTVHALMWDQSVKGIIFFWWALVQNLVPIFTGVFSDKIGHKKSLYISIIIVIIGYFLIGSQTEFIPFFIGTLLIGLGLGIFTPALLGGISLELHNNEKSQTGWGIYFMLVNLAVLIGAPLSYFLKLISWSAIFYGSAIILAFNFIILYFYKENLSKKNIESSKSTTLLKTFFSELKRKETFITILLMSGFFTIYIQFYETLQNFMVDWTDTSGIAALLHLPSYMLMTTERGVMISYEWLYTLNSIITIIFVVLISKILTKYPASKILMLAVILSSAGLFLSGFAMAGIFTITGIIVYTFGELIANPKYNEFMSKSANPENKALYMSFMNISLAIGFGIGSISGSYFYKIWAEKAGLALRYVQTHFANNNISDLSINNSIQNLQNLTLQSNKDITYLLWNEYHPWHVWLPFVILGLISALGFYFLDKYLKMRIK